uniref:Uncharacterized protein n=1 Tax=Anguilla anguilla TaxID=7936 RepID=A0A0E9T6T9_ANGAN
MCEVIFLNGLIHRKCPGETFTPFSFTAQKKKTVLVVFGIQDSIVTVMVPACIAM